MKRKAGTLLLIAALAFCPAALSEVSVGTLERVEASPNQKVALRTGPGTKYTEVFTLSQGQMRDFAILEQEKGGSVMWGMIEFDSDYGRYRAYTGMKRIDTKTSDVPYGNKEGEVYTIGKGGAHAYHGPGKDYVKMEKTVPEGTEITVYHEEQGYVLADYVLPDAEPQQRDKELPQVTRGWIRASAVRGYRASTSEGK
ncbi:MAG: hypothetical protein Q4G52_08580 [Clostridia bacterium]|nr:hypothetical protein [Clostridia bacterium]